jgi:hypothetical protein
MERAPKAPVNSFSDILEADQEVRLRAAEVLAQKS